MKYKEFSKISVHNHFGGVGADYSFNDSPSKKRTFDMVSAEAKIDSADGLDFELLGFTNHNHFWKKEYIQLKQYINSKKYNISLLPGVEFDVKKIFLIIKDSMLFFLFQKMMI